MFFGTIGVGITAVVGIVQFLWNLVRWEVNWSLKPVDEYFKKNAIGIDIWASSLLYPVWNETLIKDASLAPFGEHGETMSLALGLNKVMGNLTSLGVFVCNILNWMEEDHVEKAVENERIRNLKYSHGK